jgi:hypothetical protein
MAAPNIAQHRLHSQQIAQPTWTDPRQTVAWLGAMQAQDYAGVSWAVALRTRGATRATIAHAFAQGSLVRTWLMRGKLQIVAATDLRWLVALLGPREIAKSRRRYQQLKLDADQFAHSHAVLSHVLANSKRMTRAELFQALQDAGIFTDGQRGYHILRQAALSGLICLGPMQEKRETYVLIDEWMPSPHARPAQDEALGMLAARYFCGHGSATLKDFIRWSGLTTADARTAVEAARDQLQQSSVDDQLYWSGPNDLKSESASSSVSMARRENVALTPILFRPLRSREAQAFEAAAHQYGPYLALPVHLVDEPKQ